MKSKRSSWIIRTIVLFAAITATQSIATAQDKPAQDKPGYYTDPASGFVYRRVIRTVERPVYETKTEKKEVTAFRPETVTESVPAKSSVFVPQTLSLIHI